LNVFNLSIERPTPKARRTREEILGAALALFQERGFDGSTMRDIASAAGVSLGAAYYYFPSKEALVFAFYARTQRAAEERAAATAQGTSRFAERLRDVLGFELEQLAAYRRFVVVLGRDALDPGRPLSPFSPATRAVRDGAIGILRRAVEGSDLKVHRRLAPSLPRLLWLLQMGIIFFWLHDASPGQVRTRRVVDASVALVDRLLPLTALPVPGVGRIVALAVTVLDELASWEDDLREATP
jgi:AcrR family transcriptional regulator